jgi:glycosyltransferase involved in cell wall biosynthesis
MLFPPPACLRVRVLLHGASDDPGPCLRALAAQTYPAEAVEVCLLRAAPIAADAALSSLRILTGPAAWRNGIEEEGCELLALLDGRGEPEPDWMATLVRQMEQYNPPCVGSAVRPASPAGWPRMLPPEWASTFDRPCDYGLGDRWGRFPELRLSAAGAMLWREEALAIGGAPQAGSHAGGRREHVDAVGDWVAALIDRVAQRGQAYPYLGSPCVRLTAAVRTVPVRTLLQTAWQTGRAGPRSSVARAARSAGVATARTVVSFARGDVATATRHAVALARTAGAVGGRTSPGRPAAEPRGALAWSAWWTVRAVAAAARLRPLMGPCRLPQPRVLHVTPSDFSPDSLIGGGERAASELARAMAAHTPTTLLVFRSQGGDLEREESCGLRVRGMAARRLGGRTLNPWTPGVLAAVRDADVVHCHQPRTMIAALAVAAARRYGKPVFVSDHGADEWSAFGALGLQGWVTRYLAVSRYAAVSYGYPLERTRVVWNGTDPGRLRCEGVSRGRSVLYVGRLTPGKGAAYLLQALPPDVEAVVIGGAEDAAYVRRLQELAQGRRVRFVYVTDSYEDLARAYASAAVTVLPSLNELFGLVVAESFACGTPVIASRMGGLPEIVAHGRNGLLVPIRSPHALRSAIDWMLANPDAAQRMGAAGRSDVQARFTWDAVARRCLEAYGDGEGMGDER